MVICFKISTLVWIGTIICVSYWIYMELTMLYGLKCIRLCHLCLSLALLRPKLLLENWRDMRTLVLIKFRHNWFKQGIISPDVYDNTTLCSESHKLISSVGIRKTCLSSGRNLSLCVFSLCIRQIMKLTVLIIEDKHCFSTVTQIQCVIHTLFWPTDFW